MEKNLISLLSILLLHSYSPWNGTREKCIWHFLLVSFFRHRIEHRRWATLTTKIFPIFFLQSLNIILYMYHHGLQRFSLHKKKHLYVFWLLTIDFLHEWLVATGWLAWAVYILEFDHL